MKRGIWRGDARPGSTPKPTDPPPSKQARRATCPARASGWLEGRVRDHSVKGIFCHESPRDKPLHHVIVRLFTKGEEMPLGEALTGMDGSFEIRFSKPSLWPASLFLRLFLPYVQYNDFGLVQGAARPLRNAMRGIQAEEVAVQHSDCGTFHVPCWLRQPVEESFTPRLCVNGEHLLVEESHSSVRKALFAAEMKAAISYNRILALFGSTLLENKSMVDRRQSEDCDLPESDEYLVDMVLNGFNPCTFKTVAPDSGKPGDVYVDFSYAGLGLDTTHVTSDTTAYFARDSDGPPCELRLVAIEVRRRKGALQYSYNAMYDTPVMYVPASKASLESKLWERAKRLFRCNYFFFGEVLGHVTETKLNVEQYALAIMRNVRLSPVYTLLSPHLYGTVAAAHRNDPHVTGEDGWVLSGSATTATSVRVVMHTHFRTLNWHNFTPRTSDIDDGYTFARLQSVYWRSVLDPYVTAFLADEGNAAGIVAHWQELKLMSDELVYHSLEWNEEHLAKPWLCTNELNDSGPAHRARNRSGKWAAVSPLTTETSITLSEFLEPGSVHFKQLKQFCMYLILFTTLRHSYINDAVFDAGGDPDFASLGLEKDLTDLAVDPQDVISVDSRAKQMKRAFAVSHVKESYIVANDNGNMHPDLIRRLKEHETVFADLGYPIERIHDSIHV